MLLTTTHRPRDLNAPRAAAILYGDWGTSKAYVIGLAFALAGYAAFWPLIAVGLLSLLVGLSYVIICRFYPNGGGVYASVRRRALQNPKLEWLAIIGAFFLVADYLVTAALSALSAFYYFNSPDPVLYAAIGILMIGLLNYIGPRHTGSFAIIVAIAAVSVFTGLALLSIPFVEQGWSHLAPAPRSPLTFWTQFCTVIVALSGVETIANTTSIMKLNKGSTSENPTVTHTSTPAILWVMGEVVLYTSLFGLAATAIAGFTFTGTSVSAPGATDLENNMLSYMAQIFGTDLLGGTAGLLFSHILRVIVGLILLSAVNTAITGLIALQYIMASDGELPANCRGVNRFGVPLIPLAFAAGASAFLVLAVKNLVLLADLYAIGFVGAIAVNLGSTSTDFKLPLKGRERVFMFCVFLIMAAIEITLFIQKSHARYFVLAIMVFGMALRWLAKRAKKAPEVAPEKIAIQTEATLCVVRRISKALKQALEESNLHNTPLNILFIREQRVITDKDLMRTEQSDPLAKKVFDYARSHGKPSLLHTYYSVSDSFPDITAAYAMRLEAPRVIVDAPRSKVLAALRGNASAELRPLLPDSTTLTVI